MWRRLLRNSLGWGSDRKIIVIESDDWGSIRMPSRQVYDILVREGFNFSGGAKHFYLYDSLATADDLELLFDVLASFKDRDGNPCVFTPLTNVTNPDFEKIKSDKFDKYHYELFTETLKKYPGCERSFVLWQEGIRNKVFMPQSHGREHLSILPWMNSLKSGHKDTRIAFEQGVFGFASESCLNTSHSFAAAFDFWHESELQYHKEVIDDALKIFKKIFGYQACLFVAPNGKISSKLKQYLAQSGVKFVGGSKIQKEPVGLGKTKTTFNWLGRQSKYGLTSIVRNCLFEPASTGVNKDWVDSCLRDIQAAFMMHKPAIICSHRVNYIGAIDPKNRDNGLRMLRQLLSDVLKKWPQVEFMTTEQLGGLF